MSGIPVRVALRSRPLVKKEVVEGCQLCLEFIPNEPQVIIGGGASGGKDFTFDYTFPPDSTQQDIYNTSVKQLISNIFKGYNVTVLAYGQTGSGKTYTMGTVFSQKISEDPCQMGIIPRAVEDLFNKMKESEGCEITVKVSFLEIYKEVILDLLNQRQTGNEEIVLREDATGGVKLAGLYEIPVQSLDDTMQCLEQGSLMRTTGATAMNAQSSRSHAIFTITVDSRNHKDGSDGFQSKLHFVDLAGSERAKKTKAEGDRFKEGVNINLGLLALGNVISALCEGNARNHVPYRTSKLTRLLQDSLGGNSHTVMIACVSPADSNMEETLNTIRYAYRTRKIKNKPIVNRDPQMAEVVRLRQLVQQLQNQLSEKDHLKIESGDLGVSSSQDNKELVQKIHDLEMENDKLTRDLQQAIEQSTELYEKYLMSEMDKERLKHKLEELHQTAGITIEMINQSLEIDKNPQFQEPINLLQGIKDKIWELQVEQNKPVLESNTEDSHLESTDTTVTEGQENKSVGDFDKEIAQRQVEMHRQLNELNKALAMKEELAGRLVGNDDKINFMKQHYENNVRELEKEVAALQKEKDELCQALHAVQANAVSNKISEQRRKRLQELEEQITLQKKKILEYSKIAKMKEQSDSQVKKLNAEILEMKQVRVRLVKQMREDANRLRQFKLEKEKELCKLKQQDQRRQVEIVRKQQQFERQQNVMKRKMDEAVAANKRLKDALLQQRLNIDKRAKEREQTAQLTGAQKVKKWIEQDIELSLSTKEAARHLEDLLQDRKIISEELNELRHKLEQWSTSDSSDASAAELSSGSDSPVLDTQETLKRITGMENDLQIRTIQINDIQQKILAADQEEKGKMRWNAIQSMVEAKYGLRYLFDMCVAIKLEMALMSNSYMDLESNYNEATKHLEATQHEIEQLKHMHDKQLLQLQQEHEDKVHYLLCQLPNSGVNEAGNSGDGKNAISERLRLLEAELARLGNVKAQLQEKTKECELLIQEREVNLKMMENENTLKVTMAPPKKTAKFKRNPRRDSSYWQSPPSRTLESSSENLESDDNLNDPDWHDTPLMQRIQKLKVQNRRCPSDPIAFDTSDSEGEFTKRAIKRKSDDSKCMCRSGCTSKRCKCAKVSKICTENCGCGISCKNRQLQIL